MADDTTTTPGINQYEEFCKYWIPQLNQAYYDVLDRYASSYWDYINKAFGSAKWMGLPDGVPFFDKLAAVMSLKGGIHDLDDMALPESEILKTELFGNLIADVTPIVLDTLSESDKILLNLGERNDSSLNEAAVIDMYDLVDEVIDKLLARSKDQDIIRLSSLITVDKI